MGVDFALRIFRHLYLQTIDKARVNHLTNMEHLRDGIGLRGYGQRDPKNEYKKEGYNLFLNMMAKVSSSVLSKFFVFQLQRPEQIDQLEAEAAARHHNELDAAVARHPGEEGEIDPAELLAQVQAIAEGRSLPSNPPAAKPKPAAPKISRNDLCPCGSGKKFKKCHGATDDQSADDSDD
ncbi:MAG: SEC-C metal-binding domain-containing protein [Polyangiaceae bacterium]